MTAYYNENDPFAAAWLRKLIKAGHIAPQAEALIRAYMETMQEDIWSIS